MLYSRIFAEAVFSCRNVKAFDIWHSVTVHPALDVNRAQDKEPLVFKPGICVIGAPEAAFESFAEIRAVNRSACLLTYALDLNIVNAECSIPVDRKLTVLPQLCIRLKVKAVAYPDYAHHP